MFIETHMTENVETYAEFQMELCDLVDKAQENGLNNTLLAGILLDYRDHLKMNQCDPEVPATLNDNKGSIY